MEFNIKRETFLGGIQKTLGIVERKTTMPILNNVLIKTDHEKVKIIASDREISLTADYEAEVLNAGEITLSARKLYEMIREMQGEDVNFNANENHAAKLICQKSQYRISGMSAEDFPSVADHHTEMKMHKINSSALKGLIIKTSFAMSADEIRKNLNGVLFETDRSEGKNQVKMVATDGHRLALAYTEMEAADFLTLDKGIIIPRKGLGELRKFLEDQDEVISFGVQNGVFVVTGENSRLQIRLIDAEFPDYRRVIPSDAGVIVNFDKEAGLHALKRMNVMSTDRYSSVVFNITKDKMILSSTNPDLGEARDEIDIVFNEKDISVAFNVNYVIDAIEAIDEKDVFFEIGMDKKPCVVKPVANDRYMCIIMPLQI